MDSNGQRFWLALGGTPWIADIDGTLETAPQRLRLSSQTSNPVYPEIEANAAALLERVPMTRDKLNTRAFVDSDGFTIRATGAFPEGEAVSDSPKLHTATSPITDLVLGYDGFLYVLNGGKVLIQPLNNRYSPTPLDAAGFSAWRFAADPVEGGWALDRTANKLARLTGQIWPDPLVFQDPPASAFRPIQENPTPPVLNVVPDGWIGSGETPVAIACSPEGRLAVLLWTATDARVRLVDASGKPGPTAILGSVKKPYSLTWLSNESFAVLAAGVPEAIPYVWREGTLSPSGEIYPLRDHDGGPFLHVTDTAAEYPSRQPTADLPDHIAPRPLIALSLPALATGATGVLADPFDSGQVGTAWHRLYVETSLPPGTGFTILATANDSGTIPLASSNDWQPHHFGAITPANRQEPRAAWVPQASELPGQNGFLNEPIAPDQNGLFTILLQRANCPVRTLHGRYLHLRVELHGNLRTSPCIHALRAYGPRFSYQDKYLPALYRETLFGPEADVIAPGESSTRPDFLGRFLANFEGILTSIEDRVADSWLLTDPSHTPDEAVEWLGSWIGVAFEPWYPERHRRRHIQSAPELFQRRGTFKGLQLALDIATNNGVTKGRIVVVEDHWFRRTLQTVLGVKLDQDFDPLFGGSTISGNSKIGHTLFLSEEGMEKKFLALFDASIQLKSADQATVDNFFASLANRATVLVHEEADPDELKLIERICALETPAHIITNVRRARGDFIIGLTSLLSVDTYLRPTPAPDPVVLGLPPKLFTVIGGGALFLRPPSLDPRLT